MTILESKLISFTLMLCICYHIYMLQLLVYYLHAAPWCLIYLLFLWFFIYMLLYDILFLRCSCCSCCILFIVFSICIFLKMFMLLLLNFIYMLPIFVFLLYAALLVHFYICNMCVLNRDYLHFAVLQNSPSWSAWAQYYF